MWRLMYGRTWDSSPRATHPGTSRLTGHNVLSFCLFVCFPLSSVSCEFFGVIAFSNLSQQKIIVLADEDNGMKPIVYCDDDVVCENTQLSTGNNVHSLSPFIQPDAVHIHLHLPTQLPLPAPCTGLKIPFHVQLILSALIVIWDTSMPARPNVCLA